MPVMAEKLTEQPCFNTNQNCNDESVRDMKLEKSKFAAVRERADSQRSRRLTGQKLCRGRDKSTRLKLRRLLGDASHDRQNCQAEASAVVGKATAQIGIITTARAGGRGRRDHGEADQTTTVLMGRDYRAAAPLRSADIPVSRARHRLATSCDIA
jgi:hypothetical protein